VADWKAEVFARWVRGASDERLASVMRSPLRRILLWRVFRTMCQRVDRARAPRADAVVEFRIRGRCGRYQVVLATGGWTARRRGLRTPTVTLDLEPVSFLRLVAGPAGAPTLLLGGKLRVTGNLLLAARLPRLLNIPTAPAP
jgi:hypothetical protein